MHHAADVADAFEESSHDEFLRRKRKLAAGPHRSCRSREPSSHRARDGERDRGTRTRVGESPARRHRARHARANFARASHERKNVGASRHAGERRDTESARRRVHRARGRNARVRIRRHRSFVESGRHRFSRGIPARAPGQFDRVRFVVTAGPTREPIDPVRFLSNRSSGKMGYALAEAAVAAGNDVKLISGSASIAVPAGVKFISIMTSDELYDAVHRAVRDCDVLVMCAAVSDFKPATVERQKMPKRKTPFTLELIPTRDILASLPKENRNFFVVGFAAETHELETNARKKLLAKNCDMIVANDVSRNDSGMENDENQVTIFFRDGAPKTIARARQKITAREPVKII